MGHCSQPHFAGLAPAQKLRPSPASPESVRPARLAGPEWRARNRCVGLVAAMQQPVQLQVVSQLHPANADNWTWTTRRQSAGSWRTSGPWQGEGPWFCGLIATGLWRMRYKTKIKTAFPLQTGPSSGAIESTSEKEVGPGNRGLAQQGTKPTPTHSPVPHV